MVPGGIHTYSTMNLRFRAAPGGLTRPTRRLAKMAPARLHKRARPQDARDRPDCVPNKLQKSNGYHQAKMWTLNPPRLTVDVLPPVTSWALADGGRLRSLDRVSLDGGRSASPRGACIAIPRARRL